MKTTPSNSESEPVSGLATALKKNQEATAAVEEVAEELAVVHAVLSSEISAVAETTDLGSAVERTSQLEGKLQETAVKMEEVNLALAEQRASLSHLSSVG